MAQSETPSRYESRPSSFTVVNLACPKNQVDGEGMEQLLLRSGYGVAAEARRANAMIVDTCAFIKPATQESNQDRSGLAARKRPSQAPGSVKQRRYARAMRMQRRISLKRNRALVGEVLPVPHCDQVGKPTSPGSRPHSPSPRPVGASPPEPG